MDRLDLIVHALERNARESSDDIAIRFIAQEHAVVELTNRELRDRARAVASTLVGRRGERAVLLYPPGTDYVIALLGCFYAGVIAVPAYPPNPARLEKTLPRLIEVIRDSRASMMLAPAALVDLGRAMLASAGVEEREWIATDELTPDPSVTLTLPGPDDVAFLQYTSGSTGSPKGVVLTHGCLAHNLVACGTAISSSRGEVFVSWLPPYHDMGLIGTILTPIVWQCEMVLFSPLEFLHDPLSWLRILSKYGGHCSGAPNFAYALCVQKYDEAALAGVDLSRWHVAFCGAETIRSSVMTVFAEKFAKFGLKKTALYPCYGLAEATLCVAGNRRGEGVQVDETLGRGAEGVSVSCGRPVIDAVVRIVDPSSKVVLGPGVEGEIWVASPSNARGYFGKPEETEAIFHARVPDDPAHYLRTGDLGIFDAAGRLHVTGRWKEVMIVRGRNHYPQDIERTAELSHPSLRKGCAAAFSWEASDGSEGIALAIEVDRRHHDRRRSGSNAVGEERRGGPDRRRERGDDAATSAELGLPFNPREIVQAIRLAVASQYGVRLARVCLVAPGSVPKTTSGKIQRLACRKLLEESSLSILHDDVLSSELKPRSSRSSTEIEAWLREWLVKRGIDQALLDPRRPFVEYGLDSKDEVQVSAELGAWLEVRLAPTLAWDFPNIRALANHLGNAAPASTVSVESPRALADARVDEPVAIVGMACRFPKSDGLDAFWKVLVERQDTTGPFPPERLRLVDAASASATWPSGGYLDGIDRFDPALFGIDDEEADHVDPQQRLVLECAWHALENAGVCVDVERQAEVGVFVGVQSQDYGILSADAAGSSWITGSSSAVASNRVSYQFNFCGPSLTVDTACSSSLVAVHLACEAIKRRECRVALAGGVNVVLQHNISRGLLSLGVLSPTGKSRAFSADADGYARGEGVGMLVLKRLSDAQRDGDRVYAVLLGSAVAQDGRTNGIVAPNRHAQAALVRSALRAASLSPDDVQYVEAHGTGTSIGDTIEATALAEVFSPERRAPPCWVGSVKTNIGHLESAAGVAGIIKTSLAIHHGTIPPSLHVERLNPAIPFDEIPIRVATTPLAWEAERRVAGVSSFGFGGTIAHAILASPPETTAPSENGAVRAHLLMMSAHDAEALREVAAAYRRQLLAGEGPHDVCASAANRRSLLQHRMAAYGLTRDELVADLTALTESAAAWADRYRGRAPERRQIGFVFSGQGTQTIGMARELLEQEAFAETFRRCDAIVHERAGWSLLELVQGADDGKFGQTEFVQPLLVAYQISLAAYLAACGVTPTCVVGHSLGEISAAQVAGALDLESALRLAVARGKAMQRAAGRGAILHVPVALGDARRALALHGGRSLQIAGVNSPLSISISGRREELESLAAHLEGAGIRGARMLRFVDIPFHNTDLLGDVAPGIEAALEGVVVMPAKLPIFSTLYGRVLREGELGGAYFREQALSTVAFAEAVHAMYGAGIRLFVELGPRAALEGAVVASCPAEGAPVEAFSAIDADIGESKSFTSLLARLFARGVELRREVIVGSGRFVAPEPYPMRRAPYWLGTTRGGEADLRYGIDWERAPLDPAARLAAVRAVVIAPRSVLGRLSLAVASRGGDVWGEVASDEPGALEAARAAIARGPSHVVVAHELIDAAARASRALLPRIVDSASFAIEVAKAARELASPAHLLFLTERAIARPGDAFTAELAFDGAGVWGLAGTLVESPESFAAVVDLERRGDADLEAAVSEMSVDRPERVVYRGGERLVQRLVRRPPSPPAPWPLRADGAYLITGGLGEVGLELARALAERGARHIVLASRRELPPRSSWGKLAPGSDWALLIDELIALERRGVDVFVVSLDLARLEAVREFASAYETERRPPIVGVVHAAGTPMGRELHEENLSADLEERFGAKVCGAVHLTACFPALDFLVHVSSMAGITGSRSLPYAMANAMLDAHALACTHAGAVVRSHAWGYWATRSVERVFEKIGRPPAAIGLLRRDEGRALFAGGFEPTDPYSLFAKIRWAALVEVGFQLPPLFDRLASDRGGSGEVTDIVTTDLATTVTGLCALVASLLRVAPSEIDPTESLAALGLSSLATTRLAARLRQLTPHPLRLADVMRARSIEDLARLVHRAGAKSSSSVVTPPLKPALTRRGLKEGPLSTSQERFLFLEQFEPGTRIHQLPMLVSVQGRIDTAYLERAFNRVIGRHESLRTIFADVEGRACQRVLAELPVRVKRQSALETEIPALARALAWEPFDLARGPLLRVTVLDVSEAKRFLAVVAHHTVMDGLSADVLLAELAHFYASEETGRRGDLPELPLQYLDFAAWQREQEEDAASLAFWREALADIEPLDVPTDRPRGNRLAHEGGLVTIEVDQEIARGLRALARSRAATLFVVLVSAYGALLRRTSGRSSFAVGTPVSSRPAVELEGLIGLFVDTAAIPFDVSASVRFEALVDDVQRRVTDVLARTDVPFESVVRAVQPARDLSRTPIFQTLFTLLPAKHVSATPMGSLTLENRRVDWGIAPFEWSVDVAELASGALQISIVYDRSLYEPATAERFAAHFGRLLEAFSRDASIPIGEVLLLDAVERSALLESATGQELGAPAFTSVHAGVEARVSTSPDRIALEHLDERVTFADLDARANGVARALRERGVGAEDVVGVFATRGVEMVVALLGVLKAGAAYLPLDPTYPEARLVAMRADSCARVVLTAGGAVASAGLFGTAELLPVGTVSRREEPLGLPIHPEQTAYVIYTSGSTGEAKGVRVPHRAVVHFLAGMDRVLGPPDLEERGAWLAVTSISFDISVLEIFGALSRGLRVVVHPEGAGRGESSESVYEAIEKRKITHFQCTPTLLRVVEGEMGSTPSGLRALLVGGEALDPDLAGRLVARLGEGKVHNMYGPTETTVWSSTWCVPRSAPRVTIGRALGNQRLVVLDERLDLAPVGIVGEIYIAGSGVTTGYHARAQLTADRFVPDPFGQPGARMYRTGDLGRRLASGEIEYLRRADTQVKVRGHRIELGEIEVALRQEPTVGDAVVLVIGEAADVRIAAYVSARDPSKPPEESALRRALHDRLPAFMVPSSVTVLDVLPVLPNGKIDRRALPESKQHADGVYEAPQTSSEQLVASLWEEVLGLTRVGRRDNFFALGGHSLAAATLVGKLRVLRSIEVPLRTVFDHPFLTEFAGALDDLDEASLLEFVDEDDFERVTGLIRKLPPDSGEEGEE